MVPKENFEIFLLKKWFGWVYMDHNGSYGESIFQDFEKIHNIVVLLEFIFASINHVKRENFNLWVVFYKNS
jgi:hypothetical protein